MTARGKAYKVERDLRDAKSSVDKKDHMSASTSWFTKFVKTTISFNLCEPLKKLELPPFQR